MLGTKLSPKAINRLDDMQIFKSMSFSIYWFLQQSPTQHMPDWTSGDFHNTARKSVLGSLNH